MTIKKYYQNGKLASVGFDSLAEVFAYRNPNLDLIEEVPSNEFKLKEGYKEKLEKNKKFRKFIKKNR